MKKVLLILGCFLMDIVALGNKTKPVADVHALQVPQQIEVVQKRPLEIKAEEVGSLEWFMQPQNLISILTLIISIIALLQIYYSKIALRQDVKNRNLNSLSEVDRFFIEKPELWQFYDSYKTSAEKVDNDKLRGLIYFKINSFEITLLEKNMSRSTQIAWENYLIYCLQHSTVFREEVETIILDYGYKGLFGYNFLFKLSSLYKEAFGNKSEYKTKLENDAGFINALITYKSKQTNVNKRCDELFNNAEIEAIESSDETIKNKIIKYIKSNPKAPKIDILIKYYELKMRSNWSCYKRFSNRIENVLKRFKIKLC